MIPHRMPDTMSHNEISANGRKDRLAACRKRLRENRVMLKFQASVSVTELFPEAAAPTAAVQGNRTCFPFGEQTEEQEVGIT